MRTFAVYTLGCKVNSYESEAIAKMFEASDYRRVEFTSKADVYVINTCTVTNTGDSKSRKMIRRAIKQNPEAAICVVGCYAQVAPTEIVAIEGVNIVLGTQHREQLVDIVEDFFMTREPKLDVKDIMKVKKFEPLSTDTFLENTRAYLKIQEGCNNFCTYCIIPYARGLMRSRDKDDVIIQAQKLVNNGYMEIVLAGIHTAGYGQDFENYSFYDLLKDLVTKVDGIKRLRISSIEASQITKEIVELIKSSGIIVNHLHIPIQSGSDSVLKRMNRKYTKQEFMDKIAYIRSELPDISITTDVIVGFPGETEDEFSEMYQCIKDIGFNQLHVFPYSKRKNTPASRMIDQVDDKTKAKRVRALIMLSEQLAENYAKKFENSSMDVIFEEEKDGYLIGHSASYLKIMVKANRKYLKTMQPVTIVKAGFPFCIGELERKYNEDN